MKKPEQLEASYIREKLPEFEAKTRAFFSGDMSLKDYKGFSGKYGSYAQRNKNGSMIRLRMPSGRLNKEKLKFIVDTAKEGKTDLAHFTTCQTVQLHNMKQDDLFETMDKALDVGIFCYGGGGDFPRNVMCSPLSGTEKDEYFDVMPYAITMGDFLMHFIDAPKMPRKLKVAMSNSPENLPHATFRDLGFAAREDGTFDVYACGGLGVNPRLGVKVAEGVDPLDMLYYAKAMIHTFRKYGNYQQRTKARTRFMIEALGSEEAFIEAFHKELEAIRESEDLHLDSIDLIETSKKGNGETLEESWFILPQKQEGLYSVKWHPVGGSPKLDILAELSEAIEPMEDVELRLAPDETCYIINLNAEEARKVQSIIEEDAAKNPFETSISCIGASICQVGVRDSQALLDKIIQAAREAGIQDNALPQVHISGCPSSCGTHQVGSIGFRGGVKLVDKKPVNAFTLFVNGNDKQGLERLGKEVGSIAETDIPDFLIKLARRVENSGKSFEEWFAENPDGIELAAAGYVD